MRSDGLVDEKFVFMSLPGFSLLLLGAGGLGLVVPGIGGAFGSVLGPVLAILCGAVAVFGFVLSVWGLFATTTPQWTLPRWAKK